MKRLLTTCYGRVKHLPAGTLQFQTSNTSPEWWQPPTKRAALELAPREFWKARSNPEQTQGIHWKARYREQLEDMLKDGSLRKVLESIPDGSAILCYESSCVDCHRGVFADFVNEKGLAEVREFDVSTVRAKPEPEEVVDNQMSLF